jgi:hypothetical protein
MVCDRRDKSPSSVRFLPMTQVTLPGEGDSMCCLSFRTKRGGGVEVRGAMQERGERGEEEWSKAMLSGEELLPPFKTSWKLLNYRMLQHLKYAYLYSY